MLVPRARLLLGIAATLLLAMFFTPLWQVALDAPQYPEGIGMKIWINTVTGAKANDLNNINNLNHYIGMKRIEPDAIPELRLMPYIVGFLVATGLGVALIGRRRLAQGWVALFLVIALAGLVDFYKWEYDYGHDLDTENAIIKIPGMSYQPPLIGSKQLLNFTARSFPGPGGVMAILALGLGVVALLIDRRAPLSHAPGSTVSALPTSRVVA